jgi:hypothetical protein
MALCVDMAGVVMSKVLQVREWDADAFHRKVLELEAEGYVSRLETYRIVADMNPDTGIVVHLHTMEMDKPE